MAERCLLYYITDRSQFRGGVDARLRALLDKVAEAASAGVDYIQLREKDLSARELEILAREVLLVVRQASSSTSTRVLINSRTDVALAVGAAGVHLPSDDVAPHHVHEAVEASADRTMPARQFLVAASCHLNQEVVRAEAEGADFAVFAPVFGKTGSSGTQPAGLAALREACTARIPVLALGGVNLENAQACLDAGAAGVAGIRLFQENKIEDVVRALRTT
jgi:thiamine-phosphate pyrophosphorylase